MSSLAAGQSRFDHSDLCASVNVWQGEQGVTQRLRLDDRELAWVKDIARGLMSDDDLVTGDIVLSFRQLQILHYFHEDYRNLSFLFANDEKLEKMDDENILAHLETAKAAVAQSFWSRLTAENRRKVILSPYFFLSPFMAVRFRRYSELNRSVASLVNMDTILDRIFGYRIGEVEQEIKTGGNILGTGYSGFWPAPHTMMTSYFDLVAALDFAGLEDGDHVVALGSGYSREGLVVRSKCPGCRYTGFELNGQRSSEFNRVVSELGWTEAKSVVADFFQDPIPEFDVAIIFQPLDNVDQVEILLSRLSYAKKTGGRVIFFAYPEYVTAIRSRHPDSKLFDSQIHPKISLVVF